MVTTAIAEALSITSVAERSIAETLALALEQRTILLLIDNFEHLLGAATVLADLLGGCRNLKILVTSRERLHLRGEHVVLVRPLELPPVSSEWANAPLADIANIPAVRLFLSRGQEVSFGFGLTDENAQVVCEICRRLEGLPLAIELAAPRVRILGPAALLTRLDSRLSALTEGARDAPARQQTMRDTIGWSYDLLTNEEQALFRRLAVFSGGIAPSAAASIASVQHDLDVDPLFGIDLLVEKNLVSEIPGPLGRPRFMMLETIREFAQDQLVLAGEEDATRRAHAQWFFDLAVVAEGDLRYGNDQIIWFARIDHELGNLRAAMSWFRAMGDGDSLIRIATALDEYWFAHSMYREFLYWLAAGRALQRALDPVVDGWSRCLESSAARLLGDIETSKRSIAEALALAESTGDPFLWGRALLGNALVCGVANDYRQKLELCKQSLPYFESIGAQNYLGLMMVEIGRAHQKLGETASAAESIDRGIALMRTTGDEWALGMTTWMRGDIAMAERDHSLAASMYRESIQLSWRTNDDCTVLFCMRGLVKLALQTKDIERATRLMSTAVCHRDNWVDAPTSISALFDDEVVIATAALGADGFQRIWEASCGLPFETAVTDSLALAGELIGIETADARYPAPTP
jgi:non-specific serine/threonine protein kinase